MRAERFVGFPLRLAEEGRTGTVGFDRHVEQLIEELLFTNPGERVNRPTLGLGVVELVFDALTDELLAAKRFMVQAGLQEWLGHLIKVENVDIRAVESRMDIIVNYQLIQDGQRRTALFRR